MYGPAVIVIALGLLVSVVVLVLALRAGRATPVHRVLWILGLIAIGGAVAYHGAIAVLMIVSGDVLSGTAVAMGSLALAGAFMTALWRPQWAGWTLIATAVGQPLLLWLLQALAGTPERDALPPEAMAMFYGLPAVVTGVLLIGAARLPRFHLLPKGPASVQ